MPTRTRPVIPVLAAVVAVLGPSACSGGDGGTPPARPVVDPAAATPQFGTILTASSEPGLGTVVVDGQGYTLYRFDQDTTKPPASNCAGDCARQWPPVLATPGSPLTVDGVPQDAVGTINRPDGSVQLTLGGWPVYRYSGDTRPGAVTGQGVAGAWAAVTPDGGKADPTT